MATYCYYIGLLHELSDPIPLRHNFIYIFLCYETQEYENKTKQHEKRKEKKVVLAGPGTNSNLHIAIDVHSRR